MVEGEIYVECIGFYFLAPFPEPEPLGILP